jgi:hypothetical protein
MVDPVSDLIHDIADGGGIRDGVFADDVEFDATVPHWRFQLHDASAVREQLADWYADPGSFEELQRIPMPDGELVTFSLTWMEGGVQHTAHQAHLLEVSDGRITRHKTWCGGRWPAGLVAEMKGG